jgi:hypothetical protein
MYSTHVVELAREPLPQFLRSGRHRVKQAHDAPQIVAPLDHIERAAPAVEPHQLRNRDAVAERKGVRKEAAQIGAGALNDGQGLGHRKLQQWITALRVEAPCHDLDRLER